ncbi:E3 ubiquitin-protein ligase AMFR-like isoform X2 [Xenia sp. Carnegie-2017]|uniref:E3 ubiquitin-protein ligase AMFR-like isoform X2 n=1 Tax=Xenia sp. Carnegie-2017 TaxID=2897299 RepID=UPI001F0465B4|nr:E3 ubiquitin-protein ligase AMFR-like isoform X2 [Xenia sp. Carnegie-2017]
MAVVLLDNLPLPSLKTYSLASFSLFIIVSIYSYDGENGTNFESIFDVLTFRSKKDPIYIWTTVNMAYCGFFLFGKIIQRLVFGNLRAIEIQHLKDKFWNFLFYKFIFVFGVLNVQKINDAMLWCAWLTIIGFCQLFTQLCHDRFQYLCHSPSTTNLQHGKVVCLVIAIIFSCCSLTGLAFFVGQYKDIHVFVFMFCEISLVLLKVLQLATKYAIHLLEVNSSTMWQNQKIVTYYCEMGFDVTILFLDMIYHIYMLIYANIFLSMASLVLGMQLRSLFHEVKQKLAKHRKIIRVRKIVHNRFTNASQENLEAMQDNRCAICWEKMENAKILKCGHMFHSECLCSWLIHDSTCPTCRHSLEEEMRNTNDQESRPPRRTLFRNHFFHFDGRQIASWFPSFSVEVLHGGDGERRQALPDSRIDAMTHVVQNIFPDIPVQLIRADLTRTNSIDVTTDNILEGNMPNAWQESSFNQPSLSSEASLLQSEEQENITSLAVSHDLEEKPPTSFTINHEEKLGSSSSDVQVNEVPGQQEEKLGSSSSDVHVNKAAGQREEKPGSSSSDVHVDNAAGQREEKQGSSSSDVHVNEPGAFGVDFALESGERQTSLVDRKKQMLQKARKRFLEKN